MAEPNLIKWIPLMSESTFFLAQTKKVKPTTTTTATDQQKGDPTSNPVPNVDKAEIC